MTYSDFPTAREQIEKGEWVLVYSQSKGITGINYYSVKKGNEYRVQYIHKSSLIGVPVMYFICGLCSVLKEFFHMVGKGSGDELFKDVISETKELLRARKHNESTGHAFSLHKRYESLEECVEAAKNDFKSKIKE